MDRRLSLHEVLLDVTGNGNVYFQPPSGHTIKYPCIKYERSDIRVSSADNLNYKLQRRYSITVIDPDPDSQIVTEVAELPQCVFDRHFKADGLNHDVFNILF